MLSLFRTEILYKVELELEIFQQLKMNGKSRKNGEDFIFHISYYCESINNNTPMFSKKFFVNKKCKHDMTGFKPVCVSVRGEEEFWNQKKQNGRMLHKSFTK